MAKAPGGKFFAFQRVLDEHDAAVKRIEEGGEQNVLVAERAELYRKDALRPAYLAAVAADPVAAAKGKVIRTLWEAHMHKSLAGVRKDVRKVSRWKGREKGRWTRGHWGKGMEAG